jgi:hypothetical protein
MPPWRRWFADEGSAPLEFITAGLLLMVPLVYLIVAISALQGAAFAAEGAARQAARVFVQSPSTAEAERASARAALVALDDFGISEDAARLDFDCLPDPRNCLTRSGTVTVTVRVLIELPLVPSFLGLDAATSVPFDATATQTVSRFWGSGISS